MFEKYCSSSIAAPFRLRMPPAGRRKSTKNTLSVYSRCVSTISCAGENETSVYPTVAASIATANVASLSFTSFSSAPRLAVASVADTSADCATATLFTAAVCHSLAATIRAGLSSSSALFSSLVTLALLSRRSLSASCNSAFAASTFASSDATAICAFFSASAADATAASRVV